MKMRVFTIGNVFPQKCSKTYYETKDGDRNVANI